MSYQVFARKYRPTGFDDVLGQDHVVRTLRNAIEQNRLAHAYLFVGPRGTGKTSTARIFAKALNCKDGPSADFDPDEELCQEIAEGRCLDVLEIDGASNNGVEQVRELRDNVKFAPARCRFKIYYIDEVHMLTAQAFNALLKTLEEPPEHVKFIFATTEPNKILPTIISRCQRFDLRRIPNQIIADHLLHIAEKEGVELEEKAAFAIGKGADGGMRDAQSMLDQLVAFCGNRIEEKDVLEIFGFTAGETVAALAGCLLTSDTVGALRLVHDQSEAGKDLGLLLADLIQYFRTLLVYQADPDAAVEDLSPEVAQCVAEQAPLATTAQLLRMVDGLAEVDSRMRWASNKRLHFELGVIQAVQSFNEVSIDDVIDALGEGGAASVARPEPRRAAPAQPRRAAPAKAEPTGTVPAPVEKAEPLTPRSGLPAAEPRAELPASPAAESEPSALAETPETFWPALLEEVEKRRPLILHWVKMATLQGLAEGRVKLGFPKSEAGSRDGLMREATRSFLEEVAGRLLGRSATLEMVIDASLAEVDDTAPTFNLAAEPASAAETTTQPKAAAPESAPAEEESDTGPQLDPDFYKDPVVKRAVERFELKLADASAES